MKLSQKERLSFIYQLRILEALYPGDADYYAKNRTALEEGYTLHYHWMFDNLYEELSEDECREVVDILDMYSEIVWALSKTDKDDPLHGHPRARFIGFDGNNETQLMSYTRYFVVDLNRFSVLKQDEYPYFNSHCPMLEIYREMLARWRSMGMPHTLNREQIAQILGA